MWIDRYASTESTNPIRRAGKNISFIYLVIYYLVTLDLLPEENVVFVTITLDGDIATEVKRRHRIGQSFAEVK